MDKWSQLSRKNPDWLDIQCNKVFDALQGLSLDQKNGVIEQVQDYLRMEEAELKIRKTNDCQLD